MINEITRVTIEGLRGADVATLQVLTQDVISLPLNQIHPTTACDLFAIAEVSDQVPEQLAQDLSAFVGRARRELSDMPDGSSFIDYTAAALLSADASLVPDTFRAMLAELETTDEDGAGQQAALAAHLRTLQRRRSRLQRRPACLEGRRGPNCSAKAPKATKAKVAKKDDTELLRDHEFVMSAPVNYETGLKESLLVGAARHKAPWEDMTDREVRSVLRAMGRRKLKTTVGRWLLNR